VINVILIALPVVQVPPLANLVQQTTIFTLRLHLVLLHAHLIHMLIQQQERVQIVIPFVKHVQQAQTLIALYVKRLRNNIISIHTLIIFVIYHAQMDIMEIPLLFYANYAIVGVLPVLDH